ncbi:MAG TPA: hypothetical protein VJI69_00500, partial [Bacteroidia bacterium]|nr:hypothetical protein [Bacteroidia bacterium]
MKKYAQGRGIEARKRDFHVLIPAIFIILLFSGCSSPVEQENSKTVNPQVSLQAVETLDENYTSFFVERCGDKGPALGDLLTCLSTIFRDFNNFTVSIADCNAFTETNFPKPCSENKTDCKTVLNFGAQYCIDELAKREGD